eukprot:5436190-Alexandrium_andersonii.AAC.1
MRAKSWAVRRLARRCAGALALFLVGPSPAGSEAGGERRAAGIASPRLHSAPAASWMAHVVRRCVDGAKSSAPS